MASDSSPRSLLILASLAEGERHGYAIKKDVAARTGGEVRLGSTTLYRLLGQLLDDGLIEESEARPAAHLDDERRRYYRVRRLERLVLAARPSVAARSR
jgi:DNA-binding PadR family transcriptional regulator